ncbi:MAG TPA: rRNA adenine N-6-methyltransferase family protein [Chlamydiales bacterium]|nr:rRNA adenine N-6-methyltransferase family protein [Chlamydiales bacterium]
MVINHLRNIISIRFTHFTLMVQSEVADRITANAGAKNFSSLSLFAQFHCQLKASFKVAASRFYPKPKVDSKVLCLVLKEMPLKESALFFAIVRRAFQQRRKMIRVSLQSLYPANLCRQALLAAHAEPDARPETLTLDQWLVFYESFWVYPK